MKLVTALTAFLLIGLLAPNADAQQGATISIGPPTSFTYPSADPDVSPVVTGPQLTINFKVTGGPVGWTITIQGTDLTSGSNTIPVSNVTWAASGSFFTPSGTLSTTPQVLAQEINHHAAGTQYGYITFSLANLWTYNVGTYTHTITFTISVP